VVKEPPIERYNRLGECMVQHPQGVFVRIEDHALAVAEAYAKGVEDRAAQDIVPLHEFQPFGKKRIWCNLCGQRESAKTHPQTEAKR
jgi:hypothetical protein